MVKVFERGNGSTDVILVGKVEKVTFGKTKNSNKDYATVKISGLEYDDSVGLEMKREYTIVFLNNEDGFYGPDMACDAIKKRNLKEGSIMAFRCSELIKPSENPDEEDSVSYFGKKSGIRFVSGGCRFTFKKNENKGLEKVDVIIGSVCVNEKDGEKSISVPVRFFNQFAKDDEEKNYTIWTRLTEEGTESGLTDDTESNLRGENNKKAIAAFIIPDINEKKEKGVTTDLSGVFSKYYKVEIE